MQLPLSALNYFKQVTYYHKNLNQKQLTAKLRNEKSSKNISNYTLESVA